MERELVANPCQNRCAWEPTDEQVSGLRLFRCAGCRSEWTRGQAWTPRDWDGNVSAEVMLERSRG